MSKNTDLDEIQSEKLEHRLSDFLSKHRNAVIGVFIAIVVIIIALLIADVVISKNKEKAFDKLSTAQTELTTAMSADSKSDAYQANIDNALVKIEALENVSGYVGYKATYVSATASYNNKEYQAALDQFLKISEKAKGTYMGSLSLYNAIACEEQLGSNDKVIEYCQQLLDVYGNEAAESPKTMFTLARIYEKQGETKLAQSQFQQLSDQFPNSEYGKLAKNSLLNY